jgi:hypothetical protein
MVKICACIVQAGARGCFDVVDVIFAAASQGTVPTVCPALGSGEAKRSEPLP